jgi:hypothetical protein
MKLLSRLMQKFRRLVGWLRFRNERGTDVSVAQNDVPAIHSAPENKATRRASSEKPIRGPGKSVRANPAESQPPVLPEVQNQSSPPPGTGENAAMNPPAAAEEQTLGTAAPLAQHASFLKPARSEWVRSPEVQSTPPRHVTPPATPPQQIHEMAASLHRLNETVSNHAHNHVTRQELKRELENLRRLMESKK